MGHHGVFSRIFHIILLHFDSIVTSYATIHPGSLAEFRAYVDSYEDKVFISAISSDSCIQVFDIILVTSV